MNNSTEAFLKDFDFIFPATRRVRGFGVDGAAAYIRKFIGGAPEVMVKISSYSKNSNGLRLHIDYISRETSLAVYDDSGHEFSDVQESLGYVTKGEALRGWINAVEAANTNSHTARRLSANIVLSMPPGVHEEGFRNGVKNFLEDQFDGHKYLYTFHDDQDHYHAHVVVATEGYDGRRLATDKDDLQLWRERFALHLEGEGIAADATPAHSRGERSRDVPRWLSETLERGTNQREVESPTYDREKESDALKERSKAWHRLSDYLSLNQEEKLAEKVIAWTAQTFKDRGRDEVETEIEGR